MGSTLGLKFWGTRGLISSPRKNTAKYGGSTTCIQVLDDHLLLAIDSGFGIANWGELLMPRILQNHEQLEIHLFFTHFHWDHIQGLPFFHPIYFPGTKLVLYSPVAPEVMFSSLDILFDGSYSPFAGIKSMPSKIEFVQMKDAHTLGSLRIDYAPVDHGRNITTLAQSPCYAYRIDRQDGQSLAIITDHEARPSATNDSLIEFAKDVDILVHDGQYTEREYKNNHGWGHSTMDQARKNALQMGAKQLLITHHAPHRNDKQIDFHLQRLQKLHQGKKAMLLDFAKEGPDYLVEAADHSLRLKAS